LNKIDLNQIQYLKEQLKDVQRVLKPIGIKNPYASYLELPTTLYNPRRSMSLYLSCIEAITFLHQYQRLVKQDNNHQSFIEVSLDDIQTANHLLKDVFIRKSDDVSASARTTLEKIKNFLIANNQTSFYTKDLKQALKFNPNNLKRHLKELEQLGYVKVTAGSRYLGFEYKIVSHEEFKQLQNDVNQSLNKQLDKLKKLKLP